MHDAGQSVRFYVSCVFKNSSLHIFMVGFMNPYGGRLGLGFGWGRGRGWGLVAYSGSVAYGAPLYNVAPYGPYYTQEQELDILQNQAKALEDRLTEIQKRISELEAETSKKLK